MAIDDLVYLWRRNTISDWPWIMSILNRLFGVLDLMIEYPIVTFIMAVIIVLLPHEEKSETSSIIPTTMLDADSPLTHLVEAAESRHKQKKKHKKHTCQKLNADMSTNNNNTSESEEKTGAAAKKRKVEESPPPVLITKSYSDFPNDANRPTLAVCSTTLTSTDLMEYVGILTKAQYYFDQQKVKNLWLQVAHQGAFLVEDVEDIKHVLTSIYTQRINNPFVERPKIYARNKTIAVKEEKK
jgi:hypothetical protein